MTSNGNRFKNCIRRKQAEKEKHHFEAKFFGGFVFKKRNIMFIS